MFYELGKKIFKFILNALHFIQVVLVFLAFFIILYWLLDLGKATFIAPFAPFFNSIKDFVHTFYQRTITTDEATVDFSFLIASFIALIIVWALKFVIEFVGDVETKYDRVHMMMKKRTEDLLNVTLEQENLMREYRNNKFLLLIKFDATNMAKDSFFHRDVNIGLAEKQKEALLLFAEELSKRIEFQKKFLDDGLLLYFNSFSNVDKILKITEEIIINIRDKYYADKWRINAILSIETYASDNEILDKIRGLIMLIRLGIQDKIICLATFKQRYQLTKNPKYRIEAQGTYTINNAQENVFVLKNQKV